MAFSGTVAKNISGHKNRLFKSFKLKSQKLQMKSNLLSDNSLNKICTLSSGSLEELVIRSSFYLTNEGLLRSLCKLSHLRQLDLGYSSNISDYVILGIANDPNLQTSLEQISLRLVKTITSKAIFTLI